MKASTRIISMAAKILDMTAFTTFLIAQDTDIAIQFLIVLIVEESGEVRRACFALPGLLDAFLD